MHQNEIDAMLESIAIPAAVRPASRPHESTLCLLRPLAEQDLGVLLNPDAAVVAKSTFDAEPAGPSGQLRRMRHTHHFLAMLLANGSPTIEASLRTGYAPGTISSLQKDPTFQELVVYYRSQQGELFAEVVKRAASLGLGFVDELQQRLEDNPESFTNKDILSALEKLLDRTILPSKAAGGQAPAPQAPINFHIEFVDAPPKQLAMTIEQPAQLVPLAGAGP